MILTNPQIANYGTSSTDNESNGPYIEGLVVREFSPIASNWRSDGTTQANLTHPRLPPSTPPTPGPKSAVATFGAKAKEKLSNPAATGQPEDQLRAPFEHLLADLAELSLLPKSAVAAVGESSVSDLKTRPDYAITVHNALVGFVELKAPGKGADPRKFKDPHDKAQWDKLRSLPNLIYTDGNAFSLWQNGELVDSVVSLIGDIESSGNKLQAPAGLLSLFENFLRWEPVPPRSAKDLAHTTARLCRLLRDEVTEQLALGSEALTDWPRIGGNCFFRTRLTKGSPTDTPRQSRSAC